MKEFIALSMMRDKKDVANMELIKFTTDKTPILISRESILTLRKPSTYLHRTLKDFGVIRKEDTWTSSWMLVTLNDI